MVEDAGALQREAIEKMWIFSLQGMQLHAPTCLETQDVWMLPRQRGKNIWDQLTQSRGPWPPETRGECEWGGTGWITIAFCLSPCFCLALGAQALTLRSPLPRVPSHSVQDPAGTGFSSACSLFLSCLDAKPNCRLPKGAVKLLAPETLLCKG